ncbi:ATP-dependent RNA helicase dhx29, partial [Desmophyllum pertusum]
MDSHREERISQLLGEMRENEHSSNNDRAQAGASGVSGASSASGASGAPAASGASACRDWYDAPYEDNEQREGGSYLYNRDQPEAGSYSRDTDMQGEFGDQFAAKTAEDVYIPDEEDNRINQPTSKYSSHAHKHLNQNTDLDKKLTEGQQTKVKSGSARYRAMQEFRKKLPAYEQKEELLQLINSEQVLVISGETGCGKTTQVAQFILDDAIARGCGSTCRVMCTQPRRISAISVAERVAAERDEKCGENGSVGFQIRLESKLPRKQGSILYCTTGVLLRWLVSDPLLLGTSHIILDEIHERDILSDFLIIILKDLLPKRPDLKLILMSATLNSEMFSAYFGNCKMSHIPGFTFPVQELYLEEIIEKTGYEVKEKAVGFGRKQPRWKQHKRTKSSAKDRRLEKSNAWLTESQWDDNEMEWQQYLHSIRGRFSPKTITTLQNMDLEKIDFQLLVRVITHISLRMEEGAILVFLPGWDDISKLHDNLKKQTLFSLTDKFCIIPLHSMMPSAKQHEVFDRPPKGVRKIVIATNIAET